METKLWFFELSYSLQVVGGVHEDVHEAIQALYPYCC